MLSEVVERQLVDTLEVVGVENTVETSAMLRHVGQTTGRRPPRSDTD